MKKSIFGVIPELFSISGHDYSRFLSQKGAAMMMEEAWRGVGSNLSQSMKKVGDERLGPTTSDELRSKKAA